MIAGSICSRDQVHLFSRCANKFVRITHDGKVLANDMSSTPRKFNLFTTFVLFFLHSNFFNKTHHLRMNLYDTCYFFLMKLLTKHGMVSFSPKISYQSFEFCVDDNFKHSVFSSNRFCRLFSLINLFTMVIQLKKKELNF